MRSLDDVLGDVSGRSVLLRADLNVPLDKSTGAITDDDITIVMGVNDNLYDGSQTIISNASCTTN